jgi:hypothetical protein
MTGNDERHSAAGASGDERPFVYLDEQAIRAAVLQRTPFDYAYVPEVMGLRVKEEILQDAPVVPERGSYGLPLLRRGPRFEAMLQDLSSPRFRRLVEEKFDIDLSDRPPVMLLVGNIGGQADEGLPHVGSKHKIVTVVVGLAREWPHAKGRLRLLNGPDLDDAAFEFPPEFGGLLMYRIGERSWHGFLPQKGPLMSLQMSYCDSESYVNNEYLRHGVSAFAKSMPGLRKVIDWMPRGGTPAGRAKKERK